MLQFPSPLHPALVHFPIVLLILGSIGALASLVTDRWNLRKWTALVLALGAIGALVAVWSGEQDKETTGVLSEAAENLLEEHSDLAHSARNFAIAAAIFGIASAFVGLKGAFRSGLTVGTAVASLICLSYIVQTGHLGGKMVYQHGVGTTNVVNSTSPANAEPSGQGNTEKTKSAED